MGWSDRQDNGLSSTLVVTGIKEEATAVKTFFLRRDDDAPILYKAGQFLTFIFDQYGREERRSYSISSSPVSGEPVSITLKRVENGSYSRYLIDNVRPGEQLTTTGVSGLFTLPNNIEGYKQIFFFAAGIGITPVYSLIKTILYSGLNIDVVLVYSNRTKTETIFYQELDELAARYPRFKVDYLYSTTFQLSRARLNKLLLPELLREHGRTDKDAMLFYTCGPFAYMRMVIYSLQEQGIPEANIRKENFDIYGPVKKIVPPDVETHNVVLRLSDKVFQFPNAYPDSILQSAKKAGIRLPYSCETGRCGSCAALCTSGKVWLSYNEVLTDVDIAAGKVLTCVGHAVGGDVKIEV